MSLKPFPSQSSLRWRRLDVVEMLEQSYQHEVPRISHSDALVDGERCLWEAKREVEMYYGERLEQYLSARTGEYVYIPAFMPHLVLNRSGASCVALVAHSAADDQVGILLLPELDALV